MIIIFEWHTCITVWLKVEFSGESINKPHENINFKLGKNDARFVMYVLVLTNKGKIMKSDQRHHP